jgi:hypothetical protein
MKIATLIAKLEKVKDRRGNVDVMLCGDGHGPYSADSVKFKVAAEDEYPDNWNMPEGYEFVEISD